jgi:hypothetical protein
MNFSSSTGFNKKVFGGGEKAIQRGARLGGFARKPHSLALVVWSWAMWTRMMGSVGGITPSSKGSRTQKEPENDQKQFHKYLLKNDRPPTTDDGPINGCHF